MGIHNIKSRSCWAHWVGKMGAEANSWKGGRIYKRGYTLIMNKGHPRADSNGYVLEHILVIEKYLGRYIKYYGIRHKDNEIVHHLNGIRADNRIENLILTDNLLEHNKIHHSLIKCAYRKFEDNTIRFNYKKKEYYINE